MADWARAAKYAKLVQVAGNAGPHGADDAAAIKALGYELLNEVSGSDLATDLDPHLGLEVSFGFLALSSEGELVVALRGTHGVWEWLEDGKFLMVPHPHGLTEDGFTSVYKSLYINKFEGNAATVTPQNYVTSLIQTGQAKNVVTCGHSLGGSLATLLAVDLLDHGVPVSALSSYTFGSPRVGDHRFADWYDARLGFETTRVENRFDLVPKLPPFLPLPYKHVSTKEELKGKFSFDPAAEHHLATYISLMEKNL